MPAVNLSPVTFRSDRQKERETLQLSDGDGKKDTEIREWKLNQNTSSLSDLQRYTWSTLYKWMTPFDLHKLYIFRDAHAHTHTHSCLRPRSPPLPFNVCSTLNCFWKKPDLLSIALIIISLITRIIIGMKPLFYIEDRKRLHKKKRRRSAASTSQPPSPPARSSLSLSDCSLPSQCRGDLSMTSPEFDIKPPPFFPSTPNWIWHGFSNNYLTYT